MKRAISGASVTALAAGLLYGSVAPVALAEEVTSQADGNVAGIETVGPIATVASSDGERWPDLPMGVAVMPRGTVLNGDFPLVYVPALRTVDAADVRVRELSSPRPDTSVVDEGSAQRGWFTVGARLKTAAEYAVDVRRGSGDWASVGSFNVSSNPASAGPATSVGSVSVSGATGQASWAWTSPTLAGPAGGVGLGLAWSSGAKASPGMPEGWRLSVSASSPWMALEESPVDVEAVDVPAAPAATRTSATRVRVDFAYPAAEARLVKRFVVEGRDSQGQWEVLARPGRSFAAADVDAIVRGSKITRVRVGAVVEGTTIWGPPARVRRSAAPVTAAPVDRHLAGAASGSLATPGDQPSVVRLVGWDGSLLTFVRNPFGVYEQVGGETPGFANGLTWIKDSEWEFAALDGKVTRFVDGMAVSVTAKGTPSASMVWSDNGRLTSLSNEVGRTMTMHYAGDAACPNWPGFVSAPRGMLCALTHPGGRVTQIGYVDAGGAAQIALIKAPGNTGETLGWDDRGRLVSVRPGLVNRIATVDSAAAGVVHSLAYDSAGRAATLTEAPAQSGGDSLVRRIDFPNVTEAGLRAWVRDGDASNAATVTVEAQGGGYDLRRVKTLDPISWQPIRVTAPYGLDMSLERDERSGLTSSSVDPVGRRTTYAYDELGQVTSVTGPSTSESMGTRNSTNYDTRRVNGTDKSLAGLRAQVYQRDSYAGGVTAEFWESDYSRGGLSGEWNGRGTQFSAQASGVWTPAESDDAAGARDGWDFEVSASGGAGVSLVIGGVVCPASSTVCRVDDLPEGPKSVTVQVADAPSSGWFSVSAAPRGERLAPVAFDALRPGFGLATVAASNDDLPGGTDSSRTDYSFDDPALGQMSQVRSPGGLVTELDYESAAAGDGQWGRLTTRTTPGGLTQTTTYWPDAASVSLPEVCGSERVDVSGQPKTITRQDGTTVTTYYDIDGRARASVTAGDSMSQTICTTYRDDGSVSASSVSINGALAESVTIDQAVDGDPRVSRTTVTHGAALPDSDGETRTSTSMVDLLGRVVSETSLAGETVETTYDVVGNVSRVVMTPPEGAGAPQLRFDYTHDPQSTFLLSTTVNGVVAATLTREASSGLVSSIDYAGAATMAMGYSPSGRVNSVTVSTDDPRITRVNDSATMTPAGRISGRNTIVRGTEASTIDVGYTYDSAGRLQRASYSGDADAVFDYRYSAEQAGACASSYAAGRDAQRTGGSRDGVEYVSCYDARGRQISTTDPLIAGPGATADIAHDGLGRVTNISGPRALAAQWGTGTELTRLDEIAADGSGLISTRWQSFNGEVVEKTLVTDSGSSAVRYAGAFVLDVANGEVTGTAAIRYALPGGASIMTAPGSKATLTLPGVDGSALVRIDVPALGSGTGEAPGSPTGVVGVYGPYGEPLASASAVSPSAVPTYGWMAAMGRETLPGTSSIVAMGDRPYHPGLGAFLAPDPVIDSGDNLYGYTSGDPINAHDASGQEENVPMVAIAIVGAVALLGGFSAGYTLGKSAVLRREFLVGRAKTMAYASIAVASVAAGGATYLAVQGQTADVGIAIGAAVGTAIVATTGTGLFAKWGASRGKRVLAARVPVAAEQVIREQVAVGAIHPALAPDAIASVRRIEATSGVEGSMAAANAIVTDAHESSKVWFQAKKKARIKVGGVLDAIEEVSEVASAQGL
jgi:RHS repeat-associated protein